MSRKQLDNLLEQEKGIILGGSITRFVIESDASDEEKGEAKREQFIEKLARSKRKRGKAQRKVNIKRKAEAEQTLIHIDEMLNLDSGISVKAGGGSTKARRKERHKMAAKIVKATTKADNHQIEARQIEDRKWEPGGKNSMAKWLRSGSSSSSRNSSNSSRSNSSSSTFIEVNHHHTDSLKHSSRTNHQRCAAENPFVG
jgi:hypothetical protein